MKTLFLKALYFLSPLVPERLYLRMVFRLRTGYKLNLRNPKTFNEKLQWLKVNYRDPKYVQLVDKYEVKDYVSRVCGGGHVVPTLGVWDSVNAINWNCLPDRFVMKVTHDSGGVIVCKDKNKLDISKARKTLEEDLKRNYWKYSREWPYKYVKRRIICEEYIEPDENNPDLMDYKFFCFDGVPRLLYVASNRSSGIANFDFFDLDFNRLKIKNGHPNSTGDFEKPVNFEKMIEVAADLSKGMPHVRVDLYNVKGRIYFGEMTFFHMSGMVPFAPHEWDLKIGEWLTLPEKK